MTLDLFIKETLNLWILVRDRLSFATTKSYKNMKAGLKAFGLPANVSHFHCFTWEDTLMQNCRPY